MFVNDLKPLPPNPKGRFNGTCPILLLKALSILETLFLKLRGTYYIEMDKLRDYQQSKTCMISYLVYRIFAHNTYCNITFKWYFSSMHCFMVNKFKLRYYKVTCIFYIKVSVKVESKKRQQNLPLL